MLFRFIENKLLEDILSKMLQIFLDALSSSLNQLQFPTTHPSTRKIRKLVCFWILSLIEWSWLNNVRVIFTFIMKLFRHFSFLNCNLFSPSGYILCLPPPHFLVMFTYLLLLTSLPSFLLCSPFPSPKLNQVAQSLKQCQTCLVFLWRLLSSVTFYQILSQYYILPHFFTLPLILHLNKTY